MIRALLQRWRSRPLRRANRCRHACAGLRDAVLDGWFRSETGELLAGFAIGARTPCSISAAAKASPPSSPPARARDLHRQRDKVRSLAQQVEAVARRPFTGLVSDSDPLPLRDACADKLVCMEVLERGQPRG